MKLIIVGKLIFLGMILFVDFQPERPEIKYTAAIVVLIAFLWFSEALPIKTF